MKKRICELSIGERFWNYGGRFEVVSRDEEFVYYISLNYTHSKMKLGAKSQQIVEIIE